MAPPTKPKTKEEQEHEAFKNRLVDDVLGKDTGDKVPMEKIVMLIWQFRDDPSVVTFMARFVAKYAGSRHVFDGIEFYLPQLAHMIIHLEVEWDDAILESWALVIAQQSLHFALQLNWILQGALEDYQPELPDMAGRPNPDYNPRFYSRCVKLLKNVERCVVYGKPRAQELQRLYETGKITRDEMIQLEQADRQFSALQITGDDYDGNQAFVPLDGWLDMQLPDYFVAEEDIKPQMTSQQPKPLSKSDEVKAAKTAEYVARYCILEKNVLNCYTNKESGACKPQSSELVLERAMSLDHRTRLVKVNDFVIAVYTAYYVFRLKFEKVEEATLWNRRLEEECTASAFFFHSQELRNEQHHKGGSTNEEQKVEDADGNNDKAATTKKLTSFLQKDLSPEELDRYNFFENERRFVHGLTAVAEDLRAIERSERKKNGPACVAKLEIPETVYVPLCNSSGLWRRIEAALPNETKVFNTKERCPVIINFLSRRGEKIKRKDKLPSPSSAVASDYNDPQLDVAQYMHSYFSLLESSKVTQMEELQEENEQEVAAEQEEHEGGRGVWQEDKPEDDNVDKNETTEPPKRQLHAVSSQRTSGNTQVQKLLKESVVTMPNKLSKRLHEQKKKSNISFMDRQTKMQPTVQIIDEHKTAGDDNASEISVEVSSVLVKDTIVYATGKQDIDPESLERAKKYVSGGETWAEKSARMLSVARKATNQEDDPHVQLEIVSCLAKSNDDLRQEVFVMQMIHYYKSVFAQAKLPLWLKTYRILSTSSSTGILEVLTDATSLDGLKKSEGYPSKKEGGLRKYFEMVYGGPESKSFQAAQRNFLRSLAGYGIVSYLLGLKDRHNGNIMIDTEGHLIFIDFGFAMGMAPGHEFSFERAPFKLTKEFIEVMGGVNSEPYKEFERLFVAGIKEARKNSQIALGLVEIMMYQSRYPCFSGFRYGNGVALEKFEKRLMLRIPDDQIEDKAKDLIKQSKQHFGTYLYDLFQKVSNGYEI